MPTQAEWNAYQAAKRLEKKTQKTDPLDSPQARAALAAAEAEDAEWEETMAKAEAFDAKVRSDESEAAKPKPVAPKPKPAKKSATERLATLSAEDLAVKVRDIRAGLPALVAKYPPGHDQNSQPVDSKPVREAKEAAAALQELAFAAEKREQSERLQQVSALNAQQRARVQIERQVSEARKRVNEQAKALRKMGRELQDLTPLTSAGDEQDKQAAALLKTFEEQFTPERIEQAVTARAVEIAAQVEASVGRTYHVDGQTVVAEAPNRSTSDKAIDPVLLRMSKSDDPGEKAFAEQQLDAAYGERWRP